MSASGEDDEHEGGEGQGPLLQGNQVNQGGGEQPGGRLLGQVRQKTAPGQGDEEQEAVSTGDSEQRRVLIPSAKKESLYQIQ